eukprot:gene12189-16329_t
MIASETKLPISYINELISFGSVYLTKSNPDFMSKNSNRKGRKNSEQITNCVNRVLEDIPDIPIGSYCRVHANPRRYHIYNNIHFLKSIQYINKNSDYIIINKHYGIPTHSTIDNYRENVLHGINSVTNNTFALTVTSRLDCCTSGLLLLGKSSFAAKSDDNYKRIDAMRGNRNNNNQTEQVIAYNWQLAELDILSCNRVHKSIIDIHVNRKQIIKRKELDFDDIDNNGDNGDNEDYYYEYDVRLVTGRTHQIRLQFSAMKCPVIGDTKYARSSGLFYNENNNNNNNNEWFGADSLW